MARLRDGLGFTAPKSYEDGIGVWLPGQKPVSLMDQFFGTSGGGDGIPTLPGGLTGSTGTAPKARTTGGSGGSGGQTAAQKAEAQARAAANNSARERALSDIARLNAEITAAQAKRLTNKTSLDALAKLVGDGPGSHASVRDNALSTIDRALTEKLSQITATFEESLRDFTANLRDNEESEHDASFVNFANRARERQDLVTQALSQGAGESDVLRSQLQALRNWSANQADINRSFFDTRSSINAGITDLNTATRTGRINEELSANAARGARWDDFYEAQGNTFADMANLDQNNYLLDSEIGAIEEQKALATGLLAWLDSGKNAEDYTPPTPKSLAAAAPREYTSPYAAQAAQMAGSYWTDPGISQATQDWQGGAQSTGDLNTTRAPGQPAPAARKRPEGATLRRW